MADKTGFCQHDAGVLKNDKLAPGAKQSFIDDVKKELVLGTEALPPSPLPCGPSLPPVPFADRLDLENEEKFPGFHENVLGMYEQIALALDIQSQFMFAPIIVDPLALAVALNLDVPTLSFPGDFIKFGFGLPLMAIKLGFDVPVDLLLELPKVLVPTPPIPKLPLPIDITVPDFQDLFNFSLWPLKIPDVFINLITQMPNLLLGLLQFDFGPFCDAILESTLFGEVHPDAIVQAVAAKVLARKTAECVVIATVGGSVGSSSGGIVGNMGRHFGYDPPPPPATKDDDPRARIVKAAKTMDGEAWSKDNKALRDVGGQFKSAKLKYTSFLLPNIVGDGSPSSIQRAFNRAAGFSSCGLFVRGCYLRGGATDNYFTSEYRDGVAISGLIDVANRKGAKIPFSRTNMPALKKGDSILVYDPRNPGREHVTMVTENYGGGTSGEVEGIQGGQIDPDNPGGYSTAIRKTRLRFSVRRGKLQAGPADGNAPTREVFAIFDAEKMTT